MGGRMSVKNQPKAPKGARISYPATYHAPKRLVEIAEAAARSLPAFWFRNERIRPHEWDQHKTHLIQGRR